MMMKGWYYDGKISARREVSLILDGESILSVRGEGVDRCCPLAEVVISPKLGATRRSLCFPDGARCEIEDDRQLDAVLRGQGKARFSRTLHRWENSLKLAFLALIITAAVVVGFIKFGVPVLARKVAFSIPPATETVVGRESLEILDRLVMKPSRLPGERQRELAERFRGMTSNLQDGRSYRLEFRQSEMIGANAFALPSGIIIITDDLVALAKHDEEIVAVLAHEIGHVRHRHAMRHLLQNSAAGLIVALVTGDITSISSLSATLPTALIDAKYSRDFETEADDAAVEYLQQNGIPLKYFADILASLESAHRKRDGGFKGKQQINPMDFLSTHPVTDQRIRRLMERK